MKRFEAYEPSSGGRQKPVVVEMSLDGFHVFDGRRNRLETCKQCGGKAIYRVSVLTHDGGGLAEIIPACQTHATDAVKNRFV
jgi:hypothetical protein